MEHFDAIIIGFGKGGKLLAADLANRGQQVAIIERSAAMYGGSCINIACIPTKALIHQAQMIKELNLASFEEKRNYHRFTKIKFRPAQRPSEYNGIYRSRLIPLIP